MQFNEHDGLPPNTDFTRIVGRKFFAAHISKFWMQYLIEDEKPEKPDVRIEIESGVVFTDQSGKETVIDNFADGGGLLCSVLGVTIERASRRDEDGGLLLEMSNGTKLAVVNDMPNYEAVVLYIGDEHIVG